MEQLQEVMEADYEIGSAIKERLIPHAISWFTGEAVEMDMDDDDEDDEDDDDEDDDDDEAGGIPKVRDPHPPLPSLPITLNQNHATEHDWHSVLLLTDFPCVVFPGSPGHRGEAS